MHGNWQLVWKKDHNFKKVAWSLMPGNGDWFGGKTITLKKGYMVFNAW